MDFNIVSSPLLISLSVKWSRLAVFTAGFTSALGLVYSAQLVRRYYYPSPERAFNFVLPLLRANEEVRKAVGAHLKPGLFRAYSYAGGLGWNRGRVQLEASRLQLNDALKKQHCIRIIMHGDSLADIVWC